MCTALNSSRSSMICCLFGAKPLPALMLIYGHLDPLQYTILGLWLKSIHCHSQNAYPNAGSNMLDNWPNSQIPQYTCPISHNAPFRTEMCSFLFTMVHCGIWDRCIMGIATMIYLIRPHCVMGHVVITQPLRLLILYFCFNLGTVSI